MNVVLDASVCLKWFLWASPSEQDVVTALGILQAVEDGRLRAIQPPHWITEVQAVMARMEVSGAGRALTIMRGLDATTAETDSVYLRACDLSHRLKQHLFDTLYHAVALEHGAVPITADEKYFAAARNEGQIERLVNFALPPGA